MTIAPKWGRLSRFLVVAALAAAAGTGAAAGANDPAYTARLTALVGPSGADLTLRVDPASGRAAVDTLKKVQLKLFAADGSLADVRNYTDLAAPGGAAEVALGTLPRGRRVEAEVLVQPGGTDRTYVLRGDATTRLRPDLVVASVQAPLQTLTTRPVDVTAQIAELNGDTGATAHVTLAGPLGPLAAPVEVSVPAGGRMPVTFPGVALTTPVPVELKVLVTDAAPLEYDATNDARTATVEVTKSELARSRLLVQSLGGYGFQFNQHVYAPITSPPPATLPDLEAKVKALEPQLVRIFYSENWEANADGKHPEWQANLDSFRRTVQLANEAGATIGIAYQSLAAARTDPAKWMGRFADVLQDLVQTRGLTNVRWVTIGNEPNSGGVTLPQYEALYRALDAELVRRGLRAQIGLIGGDLVENTEGTASSHRAWLDYMVAHMNDVIDAWAEHIYWFYDKPFRLEERLKDVAYLVQHELPERARKPTFIMEYGVRGYDSCGTKQFPRFAYYLDADCTELRRMPLAGFHKLWFAIDAAQLGFEGADNWDLYWGVLDRSNPPNQSFWMIGPPSEGWALYPSYYAFQLLLQTTARGWQVLGVDPWTADDEATRYDAPNPDQPEQELTAFAGPDGQLTVLGLDTNGRALTGPNGESSSYSIGGLPPYTTFTLALWNASGDGKNSVRGTINTDAAGVARFDVPLQAAFALTTVPVS
jgi:hypothetical protein